MSSSSTEEKWQQLSHLGDGEIHLIELAFLLLDERRK